jgi:hypothetical protein
MIDLALQYLAITFKSMALLFVAFAAIMELKTNIEPTRYYPAFRILFGVPFVIADCAVNYLLTPLFLDSPAHPLELVTGRMKRYKQQYAVARFGAAARWRYGFAMRMCQRLNRYDANHC